MMMMMMMMILRDTFYLLPFLLIEPQLSTKLPRPRKRSKAAFFTFALNFTSSVQRTGFCLLACSLARREKTSHGSNTCNTFLACHTRGMVRDRKR